LLQVRRRDQLLDPIFSEENVGSNPNGNSEENVGSNALDAVRLLHKSSMSESILVGEKGTACTRLPNVGLSCEAKDALLGCYTSKQSLVNPCGICTPEPAQEYFLHSAGGTQQHRSV
jgi:hypothetical protein